jgi:hypothetical protein
MTNPKSAFTRPRLRNVLCSLFFVAVGIAVVGEIGSLRAIAQRAPESTSPEDDTWGQMDISAVAVPTPPPCNGTLITILDEKFDDVTPPDLPPVWTAVNGIDPDGVFWQTSDSGLPSPPYDTAPNAAWVNDPPVISDKYLDISGVSATESSYVRLTFRHNFNLEASELDPNLGFDGGVLELSIDGGNTFQDITVWGSFEAGGYNRTIATNRGSPIAGRPAWSGNSEGFTTTVVNLAPELLNAVLRWRMASDNTGSSEGWRVDTTNIVWCHFIGTPTPTSTPTPTVSPSPSPSVSPSPSPSASPSPSPSASPNPSPSVSPSPSASPSATPIFPAQLGNISTRLSVGTVDNVLIGGFIITGNDSKKVIIRAIGPSLPLSGLLGDPFLELHDHTGLIIAQNDNWVDSPNKQAIIDSLPPSNDKESAIVMTLDPGAYTAIVKGSNGSTGVALVEVYDLDQSEDSKLANISTRGFVQTGDDVMIGGLIVLGSEPTKAIIRAIGPSLPLNGALTDPTLELHDKDGAIIASNDNWRSDQEAEIVATGLPPTNDAESAILATFNPAAYTAIVRGKNNTTGIALIEAYQLDQ